MAPKLRQAMKRLLVEHQDVFAWSHDGMPGINNSIIEHRLCVDPTAKKIKQKHQTFSAEKYATIAKEVDRLLAARFI